MDDFNIVWLGKALCYLESSNSQYLEGNRGAYLIFVVSSKNLGEAVNLICSELLENGLKIVGFEYFFAEKYLDREPSNYEIRLIERLDKYPVQFENVHFFKGDG
jgi:hypothetical protein